ncbi:MAG: hypothetical protein ICV85_00905 [Tolypothrix sp. T3-bin4]|nr:hypothetical protein [Tolypothrix sp. T3-bin4]
MDFNIRFNDNGDTIYSFMDEFLVVCPECSACARVVPISPEKVSSLFAPRRVACRKCGFTKDWEGSSLASGTAVDSYFQLPLWLQARCCTEVLWAYNLRHLCFIEAFVSALIRERSQDETQGWRNQSLASRLPKWLQSAKNRKQILKTIEKLKRSLEQYP